MKPSNINSQRKHKYRVWDKDNNEFNDEIWLYQNGKIDHDTIWCQNDNFVIQQYINLNDKDGIPIFEGDIIFIDDYPGFLFEVTWHDYWCSFVLNVREIPRDRLVEFNFLDIERGNASKYTVDGHIYQPN